MRIQDQLPAPYAKLFPKPFLSADFQEKKADCSNCTMAQPKYTKYKRHLKCCTYHPFLPNFLVGGILLDPHTAPAARDSLLKKIENHEFVLPIGVVPAISHQVRFNARTELEFGNREDWLCPYYNKQEQNCGVWRFRGAVCTTFFCQSSYGDKGMAFWQQSSDYLTYVEMALLEEFLVYKGFSPRQISENLHFLNRFDATKEEKEWTRLPASQVKTLWNAFDGDMVGFYKESFAFVENMKKREFQEAMGDQGLVLEKELLRQMHGVLG